MYGKYAYYFHMSNEFEYRFVGEYGKKGEKRKKREKPTPEQMAKRNQRNREKKVRLKMKANFREGDYWITLKYPSGTKKEFKKVKRDLKGFLRRMRGRYRTRMEPFKYIWRIDISKKGSPHIHILTNRIPDTDILIRETWREGGINLTLAYEEGGFAKLAAYVVKPLDPEQDPEREIKNYGCSKNLIMPEPEVKEYKRYTVERMIRDGIEPTPGFYIDPESVIYGTNPFDGYTYLKYIEYKLPERGKRDAGRNLSDNDQRGPTGDRVMVLYPGSPLEW